jgi:HUS1 checkpoint protein
MRFKAKLAPEQVSLLYSLIVPISRLASSSASSASEGGADNSLHRNGSILYMDTNRLCISTKGQSSDTDGIICFAELQAVSGIFLEHRIESNVENNVIVMELDLSQLRMALQSVSNENKSSRGDSNAHTSRTSSQSLQGTANSNNNSYSMEQHVTILKLAKRNNIPCLCLDSVSGGGNGGGGGGIQVHHTIPVRILKHTEMQYHRPPQIPLPDVQLELYAHQTATIKTVVERLKALSPHVYLSANMTGELTLSLDSDGASIRTFLSKLHPRPEDCQPGVNECCVKVDTKKLSACLQWSANSSGGSSGNGGGGNGGNGYSNYHSSNSNALVSSTLLCLVQNEMLIIHAMLQPASVGYFTYYVPVHYLSADPRENDA